jgi:pSer/pThr/pTyr-binding forkhead associated (FHA) protein
MARYAQVTTIESRGNRREIFPFSTDNSRRAPGFITATPDYKTTKKSWTNMQVKLIPLPESGLDEIVIKDQVFSVGRNHLPFKSYPQEMVSQLSRRHARIFSENGQIFLIDTQSQNGTSLNGKKLTNKPVIISDGDVIGFGNRLVYRVVVDQLNKSDPMGLDPSAEIRLTLTPNAPGLEKIAVAKFPYLVSKTDGVFAKCPSEYARDMGYISRKHAYFHVKSDGIYIEDLGSTNGTFVNGVRLNEQPVRLKSGDTIGFGGKRVLYAVNSEINVPVTVVMPDAPKGEVKAEPHPADDDQKTTFIANPNYFLEIFCAGDDESGAPADEINPDIDSPASSPKPAKTPIGRFYRKSRIFLRQAKAALAEESSERRKTWILVPLVLISVAAALILYRETASKYDIREFMEQANYERSLDLANEYLANHPNDEEIRAIATEAMLKFRVPLWVGFIQNKEFREAEAVINEAKDEDGAHNEEIAELVEVLTWVGALEKFIEERGGVESPLVIFRHEQQIDDLVEWWKTDEKGHSKALHLIANSVPQFEAIHARTFTDLRMLKHEQSFYLKAIDQLKATIDEKLDQNKATELAEILDKFELKYPRIHGIDQIRRDLEYFLSLEKAIELKKLRWIIAFVTDSPLTLPPFREKVAEFTRNDLPPAEFQQQYLSSSDAWRGGRIDPAIDLLAQLNDSAWQPFVAAELERKQTIRNQFAKLNATSSTENYGAELLKFYGLLDSTEDIYFLKAIDPEVQQQRTRIKQEADKEMELAASAWNAYVGNRKISGFQRLESGISQGFRNQAGNLAAAYRHAERGFRFYQSAQINYAPDRKALYDEILREVSYQRRSLTERENVLDPKILKAKLALLPEPPPGATDDPVRP